MLFNGKVVEIKCKMYGLFEYFLSHTHTHTALTITIKIK